MLPSMTEKHIKGYVVPIKLAHALVRMIDAEADAEGLTRSAVIRRILIKKYSEASRNP